MKKLILIISWLALVQLVSAQGPYKGGVGDGHAMVSLTLESINSIKDHSIALDIYPTILKSGQSIHVDANKNIQHAVLMDINGSVFPLVGQQDFRLPNALQSGIYTILLYDIQNQVYHAKIVLTSQ